MRTRVIVVAVMLWILALSARAFLLLQERRIASDTIAPWSLTNEWHFLFEDDTNTTDVTDEENYFDTMITRPLGNTSDDVSASGKLLKCFTYDGVDDYLADTGDNAAWYKSFKDGDKAVMLWLNTDNWADTNQQIFGTAQSSVDFTLGVVPGNVFRWSLSDSDGDTVTVDYSTTNFSDGTWYHITVTWDESDGIIEMFVDAQSIGSATNANLINGDFDDLGPAKDFRIGARKNSSNDEDNFWDGEIDDARGLNFIPTQAQIDGIYNNGNGTQDDSGP